MKHYLRVHPDEVKKKSVFSLLISNLGVTGWLIIINILVYFAAFVFGAFSSLDCDRTICHYLAIQPNHLFLDNYYWTLLTSIFMHANFFHLFVNMFSLFFIGKFLELILGPRRYFWLYIFSGIFAGLFFSLLSFYFGSTIVGRGIFGDPHTFAVGASGAIFAIAGVLALLTPKNKVYLIAGPLLALIAQAVSSSFISSEMINSGINFIATVYILISIFAMFSFNSATRKLSLPIEMPFWALPIVAIIPLMIIGLFVQLPIGNMAHLGGFIAGALYGVYLRIKYKKKTQILCEYFSN